MAAKKSPMIVSLLSSKSLTDSTLLHRYIHLHNVKLTLHTTLNPKWEKLNNIEEYERCLKLVIKKGILGAVHPEMKNSAANGLQKSQT